MVQTDKRYKENNPLIESDTAIIVTSFNGHLPFLKYSLQKYKETGKYVILSYDRHNDTPPNDILNIAHCIVAKHLTHGAEKRLGWLFDIIYAAGIISLYDNFEYIVTVNGDTVWDKPKNINKLIDLMGKYNLMSASSEENLIHTCNVIFKRKCFLEFINYVKKKLEVNKPEGYSPEVLLRDFVHKNNYKVKHVDKQPVFPVGHRYQGKIDHYSSYAQNSTFKQIVGYRNLGAEHKQICLEHLEPIKKKYLNLRENGKYFSKHEQLLYKYYLTDDRRYLYRYWSEGESSDFNRRYFDLEYYGDRPLYDDSKRKELGPISERMECFNRFKCDFYILKDDKYYNGLKEEIEKRGYGDGV